MDPDNNNRRLGICIKEISADGKRDRLHQFDIGSGSYLGYRDRELNPGTGLMLSSRGMSYSYKGTLANGDKRFYKRELGPIYQVGKKKVVSGKFLPAIKLEGDTVDLVRIEMLPSLVKEETSRERLEARAESEGRTLAEVYGDRDGSLKDDPSEPISQDQKKQEPLPEAEFDAEGKAKFDFEEEPKNPDPETPGMGTY